MKKKILSLLLASALLITATGCGAATATEGTGGEGLNSEMGLGKVDEPAVDIEFDGGVVEDGFSDEYYAVGDADGYIGAEGAVGESMSGSSELGGSGSQNGGIDVEAGTLTAGEWNDNDHWSFWQDLFQLKEEWEFYRNAWSQDYMSRLRVTVASKGKPCFNADVILLDENGDELWNGRTDNTGVCWLFYPASAKPATIRATSGYNGTTVEVTDSMSYDVEFPEWVSVGSLDLMFVCDTTGSMGDELRYLQAELDSVISALPDIPLRLSMNFYRDDGDEYVVRSFDFTSDFQQAEEQLREQDYNGGGDYPEKVNAALDNAINDHEWNQNAAKIMFIILDAPPHCESDVAKEMASLVKQAAAKGIRVIPVLSSGGDKETEYLMRDFAMKTGGTYLFLTDDSGVSTGQHIQPTTGEYTVEKLNELMIKVITRYIDNPEAVPEYRDIEVEVIAEPQQTEPADGPQVSQDFTTFFTDGGSYDVDGAITLMGYYEEGKFIGELQNETGIDVSFTRWVRLKKITDGQEEVVKHNPDAAMEEDMIIVPAGGFAVVERDLTYMFGELAEGEYIVAITVFDNASGGSASISAAVYIEDAVSFVDEPAYV